MNRELEATWDKTQKDVDHMLSETEATVKQRRLNGIENVLNSAKESKELFTDFTTVRLNSLRTALQKNVESRNTLRKLEGSMEVLTKRIKGVYNPTILEKYVRETDAALEAEVRVSWIYTYINYKILSDYQDNYMDFMQFYIVNKD